MSDPEVTPIEALAAIVQSAEFAAVKAAVAALDPTIMLEPTIAPHLRAMEIGMNALAAVPELQPAEPEEDVEGGEEEPPAE